MYNCCLALWQNVKCFHLEVALNKRVCEKNKCKCNLYVHCFKTLLQEVIETQEKTITDLLKSVKEQHEQLNYQNGKIKSLEDKVIHCVIKRIFSDASHLYLFALLQVYKHILFSAELRQFSRHRRKIYGFKPRNTWPLWVLDNEFHQWNYRHKR